MQIKEVIQKLEELAPRVYQESYDNSGVITGNTALDLTGVLVCLDSTEAVIEEAIEKKCNLVVAHHPIVFSGMKSLTGKTYVERTVIAAIKNDIVIYAIHTNLDNVADGVNKKIGDLIGVAEKKALLPKKNVLKKLVTYVPVEHSEGLREALFNAGAGKIGNYSNCSFNTTGLGTFKAESGSTPYVGTVGDLHKESEEKVEVVCSTGHLPQVISALLQYHPYEEVAYEIYDLNNTHHSIGSGMVGDLPAPMYTSTFLDRLKEKFDLKVIRHTSIHTQEVQRIAWCGGSGSFLLQQARREKADIFITGDFKYHEFFDTENDIIIADIGHYESEQFTVELLGDFLKENFPKFAVHLTDVNTNPVKYY